MGATYEPQLQEARAHAAQALLHGRRHRRHARSDGADVRRRRQLPRAGSRRRAGFGAQDDLRRRVERGAPHARGWRDDDERRRDRREERDRRALPPRSRLVSGSPCRPTSSLGDARARTVRFVLVNEFRDDLDGDPPDVDRADRVAGDEGASSLASRDVADGAPTRESTLSGTSSSRIRSRTTSIWRRPTIDAVELRATRTRSGSRSAGCSSARSS